MECILASRCIAEHTKIFPKETDLLGVWMGVQKKKLTNGRKSFSLLFFHSNAIIQLRVCYCLFSFLFHSFFAHPGSYIIALVLHLFLAFLSFSYFILLLKVFLLLKVSFKNFNYWNALRLRALKVCI